MHLPLGCDKQKTTDGGRKGSWGGRLEAGVQCQRISAVPIGITVSASPSRLLWYLSCRNKKGTPPAGTSAIVFAKDFS